MNRDVVSAWLAIYEKAWRTAGVDLLGSLFTEDASYLQGPYDQPVVGLPAIGRMWEETRDGADEVFTSTTAIIAVDGPTAVVRVEVCQETGQVGVRVEVKYGEPVTQEYRDLWIMRFDDDGRCCAYEEWPFWPGQPHTAD